MKLSEIFVVVITKWDRFLKKYYVKKPNVPLSRIYENTSEPNCEGIRESSALRGIRTGLVPCLARRWQTARTSGFFFRQNAWLAASLLQGWILRDFR
jgi:hypothetical protein